MYYLVFGIALIIFAALLISAKKLTAKAPRKIGIKSVTLAFLVVFLTRYYFYLDAPQHYVGLSLSPISPVLTVICNIFSWLSYAGVAMLLLTPFFNIATTRNLIKYLFTPVFVVCSALIPYMISFLTGNEGDVFTKISSFAYPVEIAFALILCAYYWAGNPTFKTTKEEKRNMFLTLVPVLICSMPSYVPQVFFGKANTLYLVNDLTFVHRIFLYCGFIIPLVLYYSLRNKSDEVKRFSLTYLSVATLITFCLRYKYTTFLTPTSWPIHLCNTAMFIVPICLIFNMKKLFYFTYFINVMGAFIAMAMPNYADGTNLISSQLVNFWINHFCAFFMPLICVALNVFERPKIKQFYYSMVWFCLYFVAVLVLNAWFSNYNAEVDFFFLNSDYIPDKLGTWAERIFSIEAQFSIGTYNFKFYPLFQSLFFLVYVGIAFGIWFVYEQFFTLFEGLEDMLSRNKKIKIEQIALAAQMNGREITEPMNAEAGIRLELKNFSKKYATSKIYAVKDASLIINGGEIFGFLGPNGAGKSTIIKSIVGIQPITSGEIEVCGYDVQRQPVMAKRQIGYVPDHYALYEKLTGREYINYIADIYDVSKEERDERINKMVERFELTGSFDNSMKTYSHGMKQKITIMAALVHEPKIWILDEPLTGLDPNSIYQVKECMREHAAKGNIVFFSSHIIDVVERICDKITIIRKGEILLTKTVAEIEAICPLEDFYMQAINGGNNVKVDETAQFVPTK